MYLLSLTNTNANANANTNVNTNANTESDQKQIKNNLDEKLRSKLRWFAGKRSAMCGTDDYQMLDLACLNTIQFSLVVPVLLKVSDESDFIFGKQRKCKWSSRALVLKQLFKPSDFEKSKSLCYKDNGMEAPQ